MKRVKQFMMSNGSKLSRYALLFTYLFFMNNMSAYADNKVTAPVSIGTVASTVGQTVLSLGTIISDIALVAGIGFLLASFFKFDQHKKNPTQVPVSQPLTLLILGAALCLFPTIMPLVQTAAFGTQAAKGTVGTATVSGLIGSS